MIEITGYKDKHYFEGNGVKSVVYLMDCMEAMRQYPDNHFDLAICDIPYGINVGKMAYLKEVKTTVLQKNGTRLNANRNKKPYAHKEWDLQPPSQEYFDELKRISKHQIIFGIEYTGWTGVGPGRIVWDKLVPKGMSFKSYETAYCSLHKTTVTVALLWSGMMQAKSIYEPTVQQGNKKLNEKRIHPCHKPVILYEILLSRYAKSGYRILDTHLGSGSNRIAAFKAGIDFVGFELDEDYFRDGNKRFENFVKQLTLF